MVKIFALLAIVFVASFTGAQLLELAIGDRAASELTIALMSLRTIMALLMLILYIFVTTQLMRELKKFDANTLSKELRMIKLLQWTVGATLMVYGIISMSLCFYFGMMDNLVHGCMKKVYYARVYEVPFDMVYHSLPCLAIMIMHSKNYKAKKGKEHSDGSTFED